MRRGTYISRRRFLVPWSRDGLRKKNESVSMQMSLTCGEIRRRPDDGKGGLADFWMRDKPVFEGVPECNHFRLGDDPHEVDSLEDFIASWGDVRWRCADEEGSRTLCICCKDCAFELWWCHAALCIHLSSISHAQNQEGGEPTINTSTSAPRALIAVRNSTADLPHPGGDATSTTIRCLTPVLVGGHVGARSRSRARLPVDQPWLRCGPGEVIACCRRRAAADCEEGTWEGCLRDDGPAFAGMSSAGSGRRSRARQTDHDGIRLDG